MADSVTALKQGCEAYWAREPRDAMYRVALRWVEDNWGRPAEMADGLGVILLTWNHAAYRYGPFDFFALEQFLVENADAINAFRVREIAAFSCKDDEEQIAGLFGHALDALESVEQQRRSPVAVAKALHILAPGFFPLWDRKIAAAKGCMWKNTNFAAGCYAAFMDQVRQVIDGLEREYAAETVDFGLPAATNLGTALSEHGRRQKTMLKFLDEYYYARHTAHWV